MPELPDVTVYLEALERRIRGEPLQRMRIASPFLLRTVDPPAEAFAGRTVTGLRRMGKRLVWEFEDGLFAVIHLMIAGRLRWKDAGAMRGASVKTGGGASAGLPPIPRRLGLAAFDFPAGTVLLTEAGTKKRASLHLLRGEDALAAFDRGGVEPLEAGPEAFAGALTRENHTLKRALTDPRLLSGIGNAYSDEILHRARLSPMKLTSRLAPEETARLHEAVRAVLTEWTERLRREAGDGFPGKVTAFREGMAVHGRYRQPCRDCGAPVQRIVYAENECNYCPRCQTGGRVLADRSLSRLLKDDWPRRVEELEEGRPGRG